MPVVGIEPEHRFARPLLEHEVPALVLSRVVMAANVVGDEVEPEETDVGRQPAFENGIEHFIAKRSFAIGDDRPDGIDHGGRETAQEIALHQKDEIAGLDRRASSRIGPQIHVPAPFGDRLDVLETAAS